MTVRDWIASRRPQAAAALTERLLAALGADAELPALRAGDVCLSAAARCLGALITENRFERDSALDLLTVDALATYAFEHVSESSQSVDDVVKLAERGTRLLGQLATQRV